jgi:hypothetical protein
MRNGGRVLLAVRNLYILVSEKLVLIMMFFSVILLKKYFSISMVCYILIF